LDKEKSKHMGLFGSAKNGFGPALSFVQFGESLVNGTAQRLVTPAREERNKCDLPLAPYF
jgi:hypothetical protein